MPPSQLFSLLMAGTQGKEFNLSVHRFLVLFTNSKHTMKDDFKIHFPPTICNVLRQPQILLSFAQKL